MDRTEEYISKIREADGLQNAVLSKIVMEKRTATAEFTLITDRAYTQKDVGWAEDVTKEFLPNSLSPSIVIVKRVPDGEILRGKIYAFVKKRFPAASSFLSDSDIFVEPMKSGAQFFFNIASGDKELFDAGKILDEVSAYLRTEYCGAFYGNVRITEDTEREEIEEEVVEEEQVLSPRYFPVCGYEKIDGGDDIPKLARYIVDCNSVEESLTVCGTVTFVKEKESKKGKIYFSFTVSDGTASMRVSYFPKKAMLDKIRTLKSGDKLVFSGAMEQFNGELSYTAHRVNFGSPPENFVPEKRPSLPVPKAYHTVFPEPFSDYTQSGFFDDYEKPKDLTDNTFVVFDLETTGLNNNPAMGKMDRIIEIGAVKLRGGNVVEKFSSFIACPEKLSPVIVSLTGIQDSDLVGAPDVDKMIADFYKFADGAYLVGHNVQFDYRFVSYYGEKIGFSFDHRLYDTMTLAQELLAGEINNFKLNTLADYYGVVFNHHRAFDDALATAKVFVNLIKKRGKLP